jgi:long-chain acyl-CoA synthetase
MIVGEQEKFVGALISPNFRSLHFWASHHHISFRDNKELIAFPAVLDKFQKEINHLNKSFSPHEQVKRFKLVCEEWSAQTGELSPTLKLKRSFLHKEYENLISDIYDVGTVRGKRNGNGGWNKYRLNISSLIKFKN